MTDRTPFPRTEQDANERDRDDPLANHRAAFEIPDGIIYLVGHSLGPMTRLAREAVLRATDAEWRSRLVGAWNDAGWIDLPERVGARIAPLIGAKPHEVVIADSVSVNLFKLAAAALDLAREWVLLVETDEFPTDQYIAQGLADLAHVDIERVEPGRGLARLRETGGVLIKSMVNYRTSEVADMACFTAAELEGGGVVIWDLSHAAGVVRLDMSGARFAAGCTYKYLNGGPGAPAFCYVRDDVADRAVPPLRGWLGHDAPFAFETDYRPAEGVARFQNGTPPILSLSCLDGALSVFGDVDMAAAQEKARALGDLVLDCTRALGFDTVSIDDRDRRGGHVAIRHDHGFAIVQAMKERGVMTDFRAPDTIRFGLSPLTLSYRDVWAAMNILRDIMGNQTYTDERFQTRPKVT